MKLKRFLSMLSSRQSHNRILISTRSYYSIWVLFWQGAFAMQCSSVVKV